MGLLYGLATTLTAAESKQAAYNQLPEISPPFAPKTTNAQRQSLELKLTSVPARAGTKEFVKKPSLVSGNKSISAKELSGKSLDSDEVFSAVVNRTVLARWWIWARNDQGTGRVFKTWDDGFTGLTCSEESNSFTYSKDYQLTEDKPARYTQTVAATAPGEAVYTWDFSVPQVETAKVSSGLVFYLEEKCRELGVSINGERLQLTPIEDILKLTPNASGVRSKHLQTFNACKTVTLSPDQPENGLSFTFSGKDKISVSENYYMGRYKLRLEVPIAPNQVTGEFAIDLGPTEVPDAYAPPSVRGIDAWKHDRLHIPAAATRNIMPNPSFEQGLRYWTWFKTGSGRYQDDGASPDSYEITTESKFGSYALRSNGTFGRRPLQSFPFPVINGKEYTLSFYAKAVKRTSLSLGIGTMIPSGKPGWRDALKKHWSLTTEWTRYSYTIQAQSPALQLFLQGPKNTTIFVDGIQVEESKQVTDFISPDVEGRLVTSDPDNSLQPDDVFDARMQLSGTAGLTGNAKITFINYFRETLFEGSYSFTLDPQGRGEIALPIGNETIGTGVFTVKAKYTVNGKEPIFDYYRLSVMDYLNKEHATAELFGNSCSANQITRGDDLAKQFIRWGWGSTSAGPLDGVMQKYDLKNYCAMVFDLLETEQKVALYGDEYKDYAWHGSPKFNIRLDVISSPEKLALIEQYSYELAMKHPHQLRWAWDGELDGRSNLIRHHDFSEYAKIVTAMHKGLKRANPDAIVLPDQGPANATVLEQVSGLLQATQDTQWDALAIHHYNYCDFRDQQTAALLEVIEKEGYGDAPIYLTEGSAGGCSYFIPEWNKNVWDDRSGRPSYAASWKEYLYTAFGARSYLLTLKYWPQLRFTTLWLGSPFIDLNFAPMPMCKMVNTLGHLFGDPKFIADIHPLEDVKGLVFEDTDQTSLTAIWITGDDSEVERGLKKPASLQVDFGADTPQFIDLMGNTRHVASDDGVYTIPLAPAPLFIRGPKGSATRIASLLNKAQIIGGGSNLKAEVIPDLNGQLTVKLSNKTAREISGQLSVEQIKESFRIPASGELQMTLKEGLETASGQMQQWQDTLKISMDDGSDVDINYNLSWFFVPKVEAPLPLDPDAPEWNVIPSLPVNNWYFTPNVHTKDQRTEGQAGDLDATLQIAWDKDKLYMRVECWDNEFVQSTAEKWRPHPSQLYNNDGCVEVYFDTYADARANLKKGHDDDDYRYDFYAENEQAVDGPGSMWRLYRVFEQYAGGIAQPDDELSASGKELKCEFRREDGHYSYMMVFPLRYIMPIDLKRGSVSGLGLYIHDKDQASSDKNPYKGLSFSSEPGAHCNNRPDHYPLMILK